jgi:hypothetical protein
MVAASQEFLAAREGKPQCARAFQASACIMFANVSLAKTSHAAKPRINVGGVMQIPWKYVVIHWRPLLLQQTTRIYF